MADISPDDYKVELDLDGTWTDITAYVLQRDGISIREGSSSENTSQPDPATCSLTLDNRTGRFSPRNPSGAYYGTLTRNTPLRVSTLRGNTRLVQHSTSTLPSTSGDRVSAPDSAGLSVTGDIDLRIEASSLNWGPGDSRVIAAKWNTTSNQRSWDWEIDDGYMRLYTSANGSTTISHSATAPISLPLVGRKALRVTVDVNNGAAGHDVAFYESDSISGTWTQVGSTVTTSGTTSIFDSTASVFIGDTPNLDQTCLDWEVYKFEYRNGIGGSLVADPNFESDPSEGASSFSDGTNTWTVTNGNGGAVTARRYLFTGEVSEWPLKWDQSGSDVYVEVEAGGVLRRLQKGSVPLSSPIKRGNQYNSSAMRAYWPCEDGDNSTRIATGMLTNGFDMTVSGRPDYAADSGFRASNPLPAVQSSSWSGRVKAYTDTNEFQVRWLIYIPSSNNLTTGDVLIRVATDNGYWDVPWATTNGIWLEGHDDDGTLVDYTANMSVSKGTYYRMGIDVTQSGSNADVNLSILEPGSEVGVYASDTLNGLTVDRVKRIYVNPDQADMEGVIIGQITVEDTVASVFTLDDELSGYGGESVDESAVARINRLCMENDITFQSHGRFTDSSVMGYQPIDTLVNVIHDAANTDLGMLHESRDEIGLTYRSRQSMFNQTPQVTFDYDAGDLYSFQPVDDDQTTANDVTVTRTSGSSHRRSLASGAMSTQEPPDGVGLYNIEETVNTQDDTYLPDQAGWRLHLGTVDEARYPVISVELARSNFTEAEAADILNLRLGDLITVTNPPSWMPPDDVSLLIRGIQHDISGFVHRVTFNCAPGSAWTVGEYVGSNTADSRYDASSTVNTTINTTSTSLSVATADTVLWSHDDGDFDIRIGAERLTVTAVSGSTSPQTFTVTRSVNGVVQSHTAGDSVRLWTPSRYAITNLFTAAGAIDTDPNEPVYSEDFPEDTGWLDGTVNSNWTGSGNVYVQYRRFGRLVEVRCRGIRSGGTVTVAATGLVTNDTVGTINSAYAPSNEAVSLSSGPIGRVVSGQCNTSGQIQLTAVESAGGNIVNGDSVNICGTYLLG